MKRFNPLVWGWFLLCWGGCSSSANLRMEGLAGALVNSKPPAYSHHEVTSFDPNLIETEAPRGQLRFSGSIEKNFKPTPKFKKPLPKKKEVLNPVPKAINQFRARQ
jgi:hypothetical protein